MARRVDNESRGAPKKPAEVYCLGAEVKGRAISAEAGPPRQPLIEVLESPGPSSGAMRHLLPEREKGTAALPRPLSLGPG